jgi:hypothetical protein
MVLLMCVAFVGQALSSSVMPYHMMSMDMPNGSQDMSMMDHSNHNMNMGAADLNIDEKSINDECCSSICKCFTSGCSTFIAIIKESLNVPAFDFSQKIYSNTHLAIIQQPKSLFRPPILS